MRARIRKRGISVVNIFVFNDILFIKFFVETKKLKMISRYRKILWLYLQTNGNEKKIVDRTFCSRNHRKMAINTSPLPCYVPNLKTRERRRSYMSQRGAEN